jgi:hypothetical protein
VTRLHDGIERVGALLALAFDNLDRNTTPNTAASKLIQGEGVTICADGCTQGVLVEPITHVFVEVGFFDVEFFPD